MTPPVEVETLAEQNLDTPEEFLNELPDETEMSLFDHLEELRWRIFYALIAVVAPP